MDKLHICDDCITMPMCIKRNVSELCAVCFNFKACMADFGHSLKHFEVMYVDVPSLNRQFRIRRAAGSELIVYDMFVNDVDIHAVIIDRTAETINYGV